MDIGTKIKKIELDRSKSNGSHLYNVEAVVAGEHVNFSVRSASPVYADAEGVLDYICLDPSYGYGEQFPIREDSFKFIGYVSQSEMKQRSIISELKRQYESQKEKR